MHPKHLAIALLGLAALAVVGCRRETPDETAATPPPAADVAPATGPAPAPTDAITVVQNTAADAITHDSKGFDVKAFAGSFSGTLPCVGCPGIDTSLTLNVDGNFALTERYQQRANANTTIDGTWTVEQDGKYILLDPSSKSDQDRRYEILGKDELQLAGDAGAKLRREGT